MKCRECKAFNPEGSRFCEACGTRLAAPAPPPPSGMPSPIPSVSPTPTKKRPVGITIFGVIIGCFLIWIIYSQWIADPERTAAGAERESVFDRSPDPAPSTEIMPKPDERLEAPLKTAYDRYRRAFSRYTKLATSGGEGDIGEALAEYQSAHAEYEELFWAIPQNDAVLLFDNVNSDEIASGPALPPQIVLKERNRITSVETSHDAAAGSHPGTIRLRRIDPADHLVYGPWEAQAAVSRHNENEVIRAAAPDELVSQGTYEILVSKPETWLHNPQSRSRGFARIRGIPYDLNPKE